MFERVVGIFCEHVGVDIVDSVSEMSNLRDDLDIEHSDLINILEAVEEEYDIEIPDDISEEFETINDILNYLETVITAIKE